MKEVWKPIPGYEGFYDVSDHGRVRSIAVGRNRKTGQVLQGAVDSKGYRYLGLHKDGSAKTHKIHRLVLLAFVGPSDLECLHGDGDPSNNHLSNLRWGTTKENSDDRTRHGRVRNGRADLKECIRGHAFSGANLYERVYNGRPGRHCKKCAILRQKARRRGLSVDELIAQSKEN